MQATDTDRARDALQAIDPNCDRTAWVKTGMSFHAAGGDFDTFDAWSAQAPDLYDPRACRDVWKSFRPGKGIGPGTLFGLARDAGWRDTDRPARPAPERTRKPAEPRKAPTPTVTAAEVWARATDALEHGYADRKGAGFDALQGLRVLPQNDPLRIGGASMAGALVLPAYAPDGALQSLQLIPPEGKKMNLPGHPMSGASFTVGTPEPDKPIYICEGIGQAWACWQATGCASVVTFGSGNMGKVTAQLRQRDDSTKLVLVPDAGKESDAAAIASEHRCAVVTMPEGEAQNFDACDLSLRDGAEALAALLATATEPPVSYPLSVAFADELPERYAPPDELVEGVLTAGDGSVLYGDSNSGKTFLVIDMGAAVARGVDWLGKRTEPGLVVYLAAESPASVRCRLQAYQKHHGCKVPNFAIVQSPIDLFDGEADSDRVVQLVRQIERQRGAKVRLIVGDTLARLSAGANENAGQDMGLVVRRFDRIRTECKAHFLLIHHCGKNAANGSRGWSGIRAAVDTELEVTDSPTGRCLEVTKQRDLSTKGERIGFRLDPVTLGETKWGEPATSCVVTAADAPVKQSKVIKLGETQQAVMALLRGAGKNMKVREIADQLAEQEITRTSVYNAVNRLRDVELVEVSGGMVHLIGGKA